MNRKFTGPLEFAAQCRKCKNKVVVKIKLWMANKFLECQYLDDDRRWVKSVGPVADAAHVREILMTKKWGELAKIISVGEFYCRRGNHFFCENCVRFYRVVCDDPGWSPVDFIPKCPIHEL